MQEERTMSTNRVQFVEEEYEFLSRELAAWLSGLIGEEVDANLLNSLQDGTVLCRVIRDRIPSIQMEKFTEKTEKTSFYAKNNIAVFADACQKMGIRASECLSVSMFEKEDRKAIILAILRFALIGIKFGLQPIALVHSERLKNFIQVMPEELNPDIKELIEKEGQEQVSSTIITKEEPPAWTAEDHRTMCQLLTIMFVTVGVMMWISVKLLTSLYSRQG